MAGTGLRGFQHRLTRNGAWLSRAALGAADTTPYYPPLHILPTAAPSATAVAGDIYVGTTGILYVHNGTNFAEGGGGVLVFRETVAAAANAVDKNFFIADRAYQLVSVKECHTTASTSGTLDVKKCTGTTAPASGTTMLTATVSLAGAANTVVSGTPSATVADTKLAAGDRIGFDYGGTLTNLVDAVIEVVLRPI